MVNNSVGSISEKNIHAKNGKKSTGAEPLFEKIVLLYVSLVYKESEQSKSENYAERSHVNHLYCPWESRWKLDSSVYAITVQVNTVNTPKYKLSSILNVRSAILLEKNHGTF